jgi:hypothetical protein
VAFYVLTGLAAAAYPQRSLFLLAACLSGYGALIEVVQAIPALHRDSDLWDWVADTIAIAATLAPLALLHWREWMKEPLPTP